MSYYRFKLQIRKILGCSVVLAIVPLGVSTRGQEGATPMETQEVATTTAAPASPFDAQLDQLIPDLSAADYATRQAASGKLEKLPPEALSALRDRLGREQDAETIARLQGIIGKLEEDAAEMPTLISLDVKNASVDDVVEGIAKQTWFSVKLWPERGFPRNNSSLVSLKLEKQPLISALVQIAHLTPLQPMNMGGNHKELTLQTNGEFPSREVHSDIFLVGLTSINRNYDVDFQVRPGTEKRNQRFSLSMMALADPRLKVTEEPNSIRLLKVEDNKGNSLLPPERGLATYTQNNTWNRCFWNLGTELSYPENPGTVIRTLKGELHFKIQSRAAAVQFAVDKTKMAPQILEGMKVTVENFHKQSTSVYRAKVTVENHLMAAAHFYKLLSQNSLSFELLDEQNHVLATAPRNGGGNNTKYQFDLNFNFEDQKFQSKTLVPKQLRIALTTKQKEIVLPFEFKDVPIP